jgi:Uma2 family endonuclease
MATDTQAPHGGDKPYRLKVHQYLEMIRKGIFPPDARVELLGGILIEHSRKIPRHNFAVSELGHRLRKILPDHWLISEEKSLELGRFSRPEPDIAVIRGPHDLYRKRCPRVADVGLLIEVAESTYDYDRGLKWRAYASALIHTYWIVNLAERKIEVYRDPAGRGKTAAYRSTEIFEANGEIPVILEDLEIGRFTVKELLP